MKKLANATASCCQKFSKRSEIGKDIAPPPTPAALLIHIPTINTKGAMIY